MMYMVIIEVRISSSVFDSEVLKVSVVLWKLFCMFSGSFRLVLMLWIVLIVLFRE